MKDVKNAHDCNYQNNFIFKLKLAGDCQKSENLHFFGKNAEKGANFRFLTVSSKFMLELTNFFEVSRPSMCI